MQFKKL